MSRKIKLAKIIPLYRYLVLNEARQRLSFGFHPFVGMLRIEDGRAFLKTVEVDSGRTDAQKDDFVEQVRRQARECDAVAVWFGARGWTAPDWKPRPSKHPEGRRTLLLFESAVIGDRFWQALVLREDEDGRTVAGRWCQGGGDGAQFSGRFVNLLGGRPRLVRKERRR